MLAVVLGATCVYASPASAGGPGPQSPDSHGGKPAHFRVGAAVGDFTPPEAGRLAHDPSNCATTPAQRAQYNGARAFAFMEPYQDLQHSGHFDPGDPYLDCNGNGRWEGNLLGGGNDHPRFFTRVADPVGARAIVVSNGPRRIAVEVVDQEGLFNIYQDRIRALVERTPGVHLDGVFISATHDESAPDTLGLSGVDPFTSGVNSYFADFLVERSAAAIVQAYRSLRPASISYAEAIEPANLRQCWSSYPFVDNQLIPVLQAVDVHHQVIATLADVSQHAETLGFNGDASDPQRAWLSSDWPAFFRQELERRYGGVAIEMAGSVGSVETPEIFGSAISRTPQRFIVESHPAGCRTLFEGAGTPVPTGYFQETRTLGQMLAGAVASALEHAQPSVSGEVRGARRDICLPVTNLLFQFGGQFGVFGPRPLFTDNCRTQVPPGLPGDELKTSVSAFRIGDGEFISVPGEVFPFTFLRGFLGPQDMPFPDDPLPAWPIPHMHAPFRFVNGLADDMLGYIFPTGNGVGVPGERGNGLDPSSTDRFGCHHSDDSEAASSQTSNVVADALVRLLDSMNGAPEQIVVGRYVLPGGALSRDPLGSPELKCNVDQTFHPAGPAVAVWVQGRGIVYPAAWMSLSGRPQAGPDRNTRGYFTPDGARVWLDVFPDVATG
jgi:hypothetical protein